MFADAAAITDTLTAGAVVGLRRDILQLLATLMLLVAVLAGIPTRVVQVARHAAERTVDLVRSPAGSSITATVVAPTYLAMEPRVLLDPQRIDAVQGSRLLLEIRGTGAWLVRFGAAALPTTREAERVIVEMPVTETGYLAIEPEARDTQRRLIPISVTPDRVPAVRIDAPAKDLLLPDATGAVVVEAAAADDFGLRSLELKFTKVSGSGEQFEFEEGTLPLRLQRETDRSWRGQGRIDLVALRLSAGDSLVYRVVGRDARAEGGVGSSDTYFVEIAGPGQVTLAGFELPPDRDRYALSQQMIVVRIERLRARENTLDPDALREEAAGIAGEQRAVRANFIFLTGGHVEDEEEEAAHSHEIQEGRLENTARREIGVAIQHMGRVEQALAALQTGQALPAARAAVEALQRAFGRNRYFLRTMPVRSRLDPARRLSGDLQDASDWRRQRSASPGDAAAQTAREVLVALLDVASAPQAGRQVMSTAWLGDLAERALAVDAASEDWQAISRGLQDLRDSTASASAGEFRRSLSDLVARVSAQLRRASIASAPPGEPDARLYSSWAEEQRRR